MAAALLHDVGKLDSALGTFARAAATVWAGARGRKRVASGRGVVARYLRHDEIGGDLLERAQADGLTTAWARQHHQPETSWTVPAHIGRALKDADDD